MDKNYSIFLQFSLEKRLFQVYIFGKRAYEIKLRALRFIFGFYDSRLVYYIVLVPKILNIVLKIHTKVLFTLVFQNKIVKIKKSIMLME